MVPISKEEFTVDLGDAPALAAHSFTGVNNLDPICVGQKIEAWEPVGLIHYRGSETVPFQISTLPT